jgi:hypothetical protein
VIGKFGSRAPPFGRVKNVRFGLSAAKQWPADMIKHHRLATSQNISAASTCVANAAPVAVYRNELRHECKYFATSLSRCPSWAQPTQLIRRNRIWRIARSAHLRMQKMALVSQCSAISTSKWLTVSNIAQKCMASKINNMFKRPIRPGNNEFITV